MSAGDPTAGDADVGVQRAENSRLRSTVRHRDALNGRQRARHTTTGTTLRHHSARLVLTCPAQPRESPSAVAGIVAGGVSEHLRRAGPPSEAAACSRRRCSTASRAPSTDLAGLSSRGSQRVLERTRVAAGCASVQSGAAHCPVRLRALPSPSLRGCAAAAPPRLSRVPCARLSGCRCSRGCARSARCARGVRRAAPLPLASQPARSPPR